MEILSANPALQAQTAELPTFRLAFMTSRPDELTLSGVKGTRLKVPGRKKRWPLLAFNLASGIVKPHGRRALLIGINYSQTSLPPKDFFKRPQQDVKLMKEFLINDAAWSGGDITILTDEEGTPLNMLPTYDNIMREISCFVRSDVNEYIFLCKYSGHSSQKDEEDVTIASVKGSSQPSHTEFSHDSHPEEDKLDEYIIPMDAIVGPTLEYLEHNRIILDNVLQYHLIRPLPLGSKLLAIMDTCHSATLLDLKHHRCNRVKTWKSHVRRSLRRALIEPLWNGYARWSGGHSHNDSFNIIVKQSSHCTGYCPRRKQPLRSLAICISACKDHQTVYEGGDTPTLTQTIVKQLETRPDLSLRDLVHAVVANNEHQRDSMKQLERLARRRGDYGSSSHFHDMQQATKQVRPQIASTHPLHMKSPVTSWAKFLLKPPTVHS